MDFVQQAAHGDFEEFKHVLENELIDNTRLNKALVAAVFYRRTNVVRLLLEHGADANSERHQALRFATNYGYDEEVVRLLLEHGADVHMDNEFPLRAVVYLMKRDKSEEKYASMATLLLMYGADPTGINIPQWIVDQASVDTKPAIATPF